MRCQRQHSQAIQKIENIKIINQLNTHQAAIQATKQLLGPLMLRMVRQTRVVYFCNLGMLAKNLRQSQGIGTNLVRSEEHTSELQSLMRISYAVFCLKKKNTINSETQQQFNKNQNHCLTTYVTN